MYSRFQLAKKYLKYYFSASSGRGHGIHSPFVFGFIKHVLNDRKVYACYDKIEAVRKALSASREQIDVKDLGAGSAVIRSNSRVVGDMARSSLKPAKYAQLLFRMVQYYQPAVILELGTSFGTTTSYLASGNPAAKVFTCEGAPSIAAIARHNFDLIGVKNIELTEGDFANILAPVLQKAGSIGFAFIDGNHRMEPTLDYFRQLKARATPSSILVFDDIHWSASMEAAWDEIRRDPAVTLSIDLFFIGIIFFNPDINHKQQFSIRF